MLTLTNGLPLAGLVFYFQAYHTVYYYETVIANANVS